MPHINNLDFDHWVTKFAELGVGRDLLEELFKHDETPDFETIYKNASKFLSLYPRKDRNDIISKSWRLELLGSNTLRINIIIEGELNAGIQQNKDGFDNNMLHMAAFGGSVAAIKYILKQYPDLKDSKDNAGSNMLHYAAFGGSVDAIKHILEHYPDLKDSKDNDGRNMLHFAAEGGNVAAIKYILKEYPYLKDSRGWRGKNILHCAALGGNVAAIRYILERYPELKDSKDDAGCNMLLLAVKYGNADAIKYILERYPELKDSKDDNGYNMLRYVSERSRYSSKRDNLNLDTIKCILEHYPELKNRRNYDSGTELLLSVAKRGNVAAIKYILERYPELKYSTDLGGCNMLHCAARGGDVAAIKYILEHYPELKNSKDGYGRNMLHCAAQKRGNVAAVKYILEHYPELRDTKDRYGRNILLLVAERYNNVDDIKYILEHYPDLKNSKTDSGRNMLHFAAEGGDVAAIKYILEHYPDLKYSRTNYDRNMLHYAAFGGNVEAIQFILETYPEMYRVDISRRENWAKVKEAKNNAIKHAIDYLSGSDVCSTSYVNSVEIAVNILKQFKQESLKYIEDCMTSQSTTINLKPFVLQRQELKGLFSMDEGKKIDESSNICNHIKGICLGQNLTWHHLTNIQGYLAELLSRYDGMLNTAIDFFRPKTPEQILVDAINELLKIGNENAINMDDVISTDIANSLYNRLHTYIENSKRTAHREPYVAEIFNAVATSLLSTKLLSRMAPKPRPSRGLTIPLCGQDKQIKQDQKEQQKKNEATSSGALTKSEASRATEADVYNPLNAANESKSVSTSLASPPPSYESVNNSPSRVTGAQPKEEERTPHSVDGGDKDATGYKQKENQQQSDEYVNSSNQNLFADTNRTAPASSGDTVGSNPNILFASFPEVPSHEPIEMLDFPATPTNAVTDLTGQVTSENANQNTQPGEREKEKEKEKDPSACRMTG